MPKIKTYPIRLPADITGDEYIVVTDLSEGKTYKMNFSITAGEVGTHELTYDHSLIGTNVFNQDLNTTDDVTFNTISGDGSALSNIGNIFDQDLNTTDHTEFTGIALSDDFASQDAWMNAWDGADWQDNYRVATHFPYSAVDRVDANNIVSIADGGSFTHYAFVETIVYTHPTYEGAAVAAFVYDDTSGRYQGWKISADTFRSSLGMFWGARGDINLDCNPNVDGTLASFVSEKDLTTGKLLTMTNGTTGYYFEVAADGSVTTTGDVAANGTIVGLEPWNIVTAGANSGAEDDFTATAGNSYMVDSNLRTGGTITMTLPTTPPAGTVVEVNDMKGDFATAGKSVQTNSTLVNGTTQQFNMDVANSTTKFVYVDGTFGWRTVL